LIKLLKIASPPNPLFQFFPHKLRIWEGLGGTHIFHFFLLKITIKIYINYNRLDKKVSGISGISFLGRSKKNEKIQI